MVIKMVIAETRIKQWGNSLGLLVPKEIATHEDLSTGDIVKIEILKEKRIDAFGMFKGAPHFSKEDKADSDF